MSIFYPGLDRAREFFFHNQYHPTESTFPVQLTNSQKSHDFRDLQTDWPSTQFQVRMILCRSTTSDLHQHENNDVLGVDLYTLNSLFVLVLLTGRE